MRVIPFVFCLSFIVNEIVINLENTTSSVLYVLLLIHGSEYQYPDSSLKSVWSAKTWIVDTRPKADQLLLGEWGGDGTFSFFNKKVFYIFSCFMFFLVIHSFIITPLPPSEGGGEVSPSRNK